MKTVYNILSKVYVKVTGCKIIKNKTLIIEPRTGLMVNSYLLPTSKSHDTKTRTKIKSGPNKL